MDRIFVHELRGESGWIFTKNRNRFFVDSIKVPADVCPVPAKITGHVIVAFYEVTTNILKLQCVTEEYGLGGKKNPGIPERGIKSVCAMATVDDQNNMIQIWSEEKNLHLDVRKMLENGLEPYHQIMENLRKLPAGWSLVVHALFEPKPLILQVKRMGYGVETRRISIDNWEAWIKKAS